MSALEVERIVAERKAEAPIAETFFALLRAHAAQAPERVALIDASEARAVRYGELAAGVEDLAEKLAHKGVAGKNVVALIPRSAAVVKLILGASRAGGRCLAYVSPRDPEKALAAARRAIAPRLFVFSHATSHLTRLAQPGEVWVEYGELEAGPRAPVYFEPTGESVLYFNETSGSSGDPKIVPATHRSILENTAACVRAFGITAADTHLVLFNSHSHELYARAIYTGGTAVLLADDVADNPAAVMKALATYRVSCLMAHPTAIAALTALARNEASRFSLRLVEAGGSPTPEGLKAKVSRHLGGRLVPVWGSTETGGVAIANPIDGPQRAASVGRPLPGYRAEVVGDNGVNVKEGEYGELIISGLGVADGYLAGGNSERLKGGVFRTGDIARVDAEGWVYVRGRLVNQFKVAGVLVNSEEVEAALRQHTLVVDAAVLPVSHPTLGYVPAALIVPRFGVKDGAHERTVIQQIISAAQQHLHNPFFEIPRHIKWASEGLPLNTAGKLDRLAVRALYYDQPPRPTRVRLPRRTQLRLLMREMQSGAVWRLLRKHPLGVARLVSQVFKGDKLK